MSTVIASQCSLPALNCLHFTPHLAPETMTSQIPSLAKQSILRFDLVSASLSGSLNNFREPQLVLKTQNGSAPRVPYTGSRSQKSVRRHLLMVHVRDKASELEMLDLALFVASSKSLGSPVRNAVESLASDYSLTFRYPKGATKDRCTLWVKFQGIADFIAVLSELQALGIRIEDGTSHDIRASAERMHGQPLTLSSQSSASSLFDNSRQPYGNNTPISLSPNPEEWRTSYLMNPAYRRVRNRPSIRPASQNVSFSFAKPSFSPIHQPPRPATAIGIPGILGGGVYKISRVGSAPSSRARVRKPSRLSEIQGPSLYTVSRHFDKTLQREDIVDAMAYRFLDDDDSEFPSQDHEACASTTHGQNHLADAGRGMSNPLKASYPPVSVSAAVLRGSRLGMNLSRSRRPSVSQSISSLKPISELHPECDSSPRPDYETCTNGSYKPSGPSEQVQDSLASQHETHSVDKSGGGAHGSQQSAITNQPMDRDGSTDDIFLQAFELSYEGLQQATKIWVDLLERGRKEAEVADSVEEADKILSNYGEEWAKHLNDLAGVVVRKMRDLGSGQT